VRYLGVALLVAAVAVWLVRTILRPVYALLAMFAELGWTERSSPARTTAQAGPR
jgi:hypothetical protein